MYLLLLRILRRYLFTEAVRLLGEKVGINIGTNINVSNKKDEYFDIYSTANKFYQNSLFLLI